MPVRYDGSNFTTLDGHPLSVAQAVEWSDFARANGISNKPDSDEISANVLRTMQLLEKAYGILGCTAIVTSFYRSRELNSRVGGKIHPPSAHMSGRAVDSEPQGRQIEECFAELQKHAADLQYDQLIIERDKKGNIWLHMSVAKPGEAPRCMAFSLEKDDVTIRSSHG